MGEHWWWFIARIREERRSRQMVVEIVNFEKDILHRDRETTLSIIYGQFWRLGYVEKRVFW